MSLKAFHVVFILLSILLLVGFGIWGIQDYSQGSGSLLHLVLGLVSLQLSVLLGWYFSWFLRKLKDLSYL